jgi:hypothetical protein
MNKSRILKIVSYVCHVTWCRTYRVVCPINNSYRTLLNHCWDSVSCRVELKTVVSSEQHFIKHFTGDNILLCPSVSDL